MMLWYKSVVGDADALPDQSRDTDSALPDGRRIRRRDSNTNGRDDGSAEHLRWIRSPGHLFQRRSIPVPVVCPCPGSRRTAGGTGTGDGLSHARAPGSSVACRRGSGGCRILRDDLLGAASSGRDSGRITPGPPNVPVAQAMQFSLLWIAAYSLLFATTFLVSALLSGPYTSFLVAWVLFVAHAVIASVPRLRPFRLNLQWITSGLGMPVLRRADGSARGSVAVDPTPGHGHAFLDLGCHCCRSHRTTGFLRQTTHHVKRRAA